MATLRCTCAESGDGWAGVGPLLLNGQPRAELSLGLGRPAHRPSALARLVWHSPSSPRNVALAGFSPASASKSASAARNSVSDSLGLFVSKRSPPMLMWTCARRLRKSRTAGFSSASSRRIASAASELSLRLRRPALIRQHHGDHAVGVGEMAAVGGNGWAVVGQPLTDRQRPSELGLRFR